jgi:hypothetical protein
MKRGAPVLERWERSANRTRRTSNYSTIRIRPMSNPCKSLCEWLNFMPVRITLCGKLRAVTLREFFLENFAGDLEYHPRRAVLYLGLAVAALCFWIFSASEAKFTTIPLVFVLGSLTLLLKGIFLLRKSTEGLGLTQSELDELSHPSNRKGLSSIPNQAGQIVQDFGVGPLLLWPFLNVGKDIDQSCINPPRVPIFLTGAVLFSLGWLIRRFTSTPPEHS